MIRLILRLVAMSGFVLLGSVVGRTLGAVIGACVGTVVITQTEYLIWLLKRSAELGGDASRIVWRAVCVFFKIAIVRRMVRAGLTPGGARGHRMLNGGRAARRGRGVGP